VCSCDEILLTVTVNNVSVSDPGVNDIHGGAKKWNIRALHRYLLNAGFVFVDH